MVEKFRFHPVLNENQTLYQDEKTSMIVE